MTADQLYDHVVALCAWEESDKKDYETRFINILNLRMEECFHLNNARRAQKDLEPLKEAQIVLALEDELIYEPFLTNVVLPLGVAGYLYIDDDETGASNQFREDYLRLCAKDNEYARFVDAEMEW